jgi:predicted RecB family nuclease
LQDILQEKYGDRIEFEVPVESDKNDFAGNIDGLLRLEDDCYAVLEFKSIKSGGFKRLKEAKPEHATQVASYARFLGEAYDDAGIDVSLEAWVIYVCKDSFELIEFPVDIPSWGDRAQRVLNVLNYYGDRTPPRFPDAARRKWPCGWCNWKAVCLGGDK